MHPNPTNYSYSFISKLPVEELFELVLNVNNWWTGIHNEEIIGDFNQIGDEFSFSAGNGAHYTKQKLTELQPNSKISWLITESNLTFLSNEKEWLNTHLNFDFRQENDLTTVTFTHLGLIPKFECYGGCSNAWTKYLSHLEKRVS